MCVCCVLINKLNYGMLFILLILLLFLQMCCLFHYFVNRRSFVRFVFFLPKEDDLHDFFPSDVLHDFCNKSVMSCFSMEYDLHDLFFSRIRLASFVFEQNMTCMICFSAEYDLYHLFLKRI